MIRSEPNDGVHVGSQINEAAFEERQSVVAVFGMRIMKRQWGMGRALAWRFSARVRRWREAPCREAAMHRSKNERAASERKLARLAVARSAPPWTSSLANRQKEGADLRAV